MKISVITAVYNNHATLADALDSALAQDYPDVELEGSVNQATQPTFWRPLVAGKTAESACCRPQLLSGFSGGQHCALLLRRLADQQP